MFAVYQPDLSTFIMPFDSGTESLELSACLDHETELWPELARAAACSSDKHLRSNNNQYK